MSRRPLAPEVWEQALVNGRIVHPSSDKDVLAYAEKWYASQGGLFTGESAPVPEPAENTMSDEEFEALMLQSDHAPGPEPEQVTEQAAEQVTEQAEERPEAAPEAAPPADAPQPRRVRARKAKGRFNGDDPATPDRNEAYLDG